MSLNSFLLYYVFGASSTTLEPTERLSIILTADMFSFIPNYFLHFKAH